MCVGKVQVGVDVKSQLTRLPVPRRVSIQRGGSSPFGLEKASCSVIHKVFLCKKTGSFSKEGKLKILNNKRAYRLVCISDVPEDFQKIGSRDSKEKGQKCPESQRAYIKNNKRRKRQKSKNFKKKGQECPESNKTFSNIRTQSVRKAKKPQK